MTFFLGTHKPGWLGRLDVPLCLSYRQLKQRRSLLPATAPWILDCGGFTELRDFGTHRTPALVYARDAARLSTAGLLVAAACQDWMCEGIIRQRTGLSVTEHQARTIKSFRELRDLEPALPWMPVLQGDLPSDYLRHREAYERAGIDLAALPVVGIGSVCRRQATAEIARIVGQFPDLPLHGFGVKTQGLARYGRCLASSDSLAWSRIARMKRIRLPGCPHKTCANCARYALLWREGVLGAGLKCWNGILSPPSTQHQHPAQLSMEALLC